MLAIDDQQLNLSEEARRFLPPAPKPAQMMAARGLAPLTPGDLITVQVVLSASDDAEVAQAASDALTGHPENLLTGAVQALSAAPVLDHLARLPLSKATKEALLLNRHVSDATLVYLATHETDSVLLDILAGNQARMLAHNEIAECLLENTSLSFNSKKRLEEFFLGAFTASILESKPQASEEEEVQSLAADFANALGGAEGEGGLTSEQIEAELLREKPDEAAKVQESPEEEEQKGGLYKQIMTMRISQKVKFALKGNKEARSILIKDSNKLVSSAVLKNPRITDGEVQAIASSKSAIEDLLRIVGSNTQWMRLYATRHALIQNPKCPPAFVTKILPTLHEKDVEKLAKSKSVSGAVSTAARRLVQAKQKAREKKKK